MTKKTAIILSVVVIFFLLIFLLSGPLLNGIIKPKLLKAINKDDKNLNLSVEDLSYNLLNNDFSLEENKLFFIQSYSGSVDSFIVKAPSITIGGINWLSYIFNDNMNVSKIVIDNPSINIYETGIKNKDTSKNKSGSINSFPFNLEELSINSGSLVRKNSNSQTIDSIKNFSLQLAGIEVDSSKNKNVNIVENISLELNGIYKLFTKDGYKLQINSLSASSANSYIKINSVNFKPYVSEEEFFSKKKYRADRYIIDIKNFEANEININSLLNGDVISNEIKIEDFYLNILTPKDKPIDPDYSPEMPNEIFKSLKNKINIKKLLMFHGELIVESAYDYSRENAKLIFTNTKAEIKNISNLKSEQTENKTCEIFAAASLADAGILNVHMTLPLLSNDFSLNYSGSLSAMDTDPLNSQLMIADLVRITSGKVDSVSFDVNIKNGLSSAKAKAIYSNLKIENLIEESLNYKKEKSTFKTFIANTFIIRHSNPDKNGEEKIGRVYYSKKNDDAFMDIVWLSIKDALGDIVGF